MRRSAALLPPLLLSTLLAGCSGAGGGGRDFSDPGWEESTIAPGWSLDLEYVWPSGQRASWDWATDGGRILSFQVLNVAGGSAYPLVSMHRNESADARSVPQAGRYDYVWMNEGAQPVALHFRVPEGYILRQWPPGEGPACPPPALLGERAC